VSEAQRPLELIHARNLITGLSTPAFLVDLDGGLAFYNDAAATLLGRRFEEVGPMPQSEWGKAFPPIDADGNPLSLDSLPLVRALRDQRPSFGTLRFLAADGGQHEIHVTAIPIVTSHATHGALALFWPTEDEAP
jgi:PAS domain-containing protein